MKVVLFCGGLGTRLREHSDTIPKPLVTIGSRPVLWYLMRYYAHFGYNEFILALGYRGDMVRDYFLNYSEAMSNDFTLSDSGRKIELHSRDLDSWRITFVDTGLHSNIGQRLLRVRKYLQGEDMFLANYADGLSDLPLDQHVENFRKSDAVASIVAVRSAQSFHAIHADEHGVVTGLGAIQDQPLWINGGFFVLRSNIFDYVREGEELVEQPFARLVQERKLIVRRWEGFWQCMDTLKDKIALDRLEARGTCPWMVWRK
jgi:glucose-1-phosphate cytidylyltransferase